MATITWTWHGTTGDEVPAASAFYALVYQDGQLLDRVCPVLEWEQVRNGASIGDAIVVTGDSMEWWRQGQPEVNPNQIDEVTVAYTLTDGWQLVRCSVEPTSYLDSPPWEVP